MPALKYANPVRGPFEPNTPALAKQIWKRFKAGMGRNAICRELNASPRFVSKTIRENGGILSGAVLRNANQARVAQLEERRIALATRLYERAEHLLDRLSDEQFKALIKGSYGKDRTATLSFVPAADERALANALASVIGSAIKLQDKQHDAGPTEQQSLLEDLALELGLTDREDALDEE